MAQRGMTCGQRVEAAAGGGRAARHFACEHDVLAGVSKSIGSAAAKSLV